MRKSKVRLGAVVPMPAVIDDATEISFLDLVELRAVRALRVGGISMQAIRFAIRLAQDKFGFNRPLSTVQFKTDGPEILMDAAEKRPAQKVFKRLVAQSVSDLEYEGSLVTRWRPNTSHHVVIDPARAFGAPLIDEAGISTDMLYREWDRTRDYKFVGRLYEIPENMVRDAVQFEDRLGQGVRANSGQGLI